MNASVIKKMSRLALAATAALTAAGCAGSFAGKSTQDAALAPRVETPTAENRRYPRWADFPAASTDLPTDAEVAVRIGGLSTTGTALAADVARIDWLLGDPASFAETVNRRIDAQAMAPITAGTLADIEAFAEAARRRAEAPPPIPRR